MNNKCNQDETSLLDKDHSTTFVKEIKSSCQWTIYNFSFIPPGDKIGPIYAPDIESPLFKSGCNDDLSWDVNITNLNDIKEEYIKIYIYINDVEWHDYLSLEAKISILDDKGKEAYTIRYDPKVLSTESVNFIKKDHLMNKNNKLLTDDKLVIVCEINAFAEVYNYSWNVKDDDDYESEDRDCVGEIFKSRLQVPQDLQKLLQNNSHDSIVVVKKKEFNVHKCILAARSRVFSAMFDQEMLEQASNTVVIKDMNCKAFEDVIEFIYSGMLKNINNTRGLIEILVAADKYELSELKEICEIIFLKELKTCNALEMLNLADFYHADKLKKSIIRFIIAHNQDFVNKPEFETLLNTHSHLIPNFIQEKSEESSEVSLHLSDSFDDEETDNSCINHIHMPPANSSLDEKLWSVTEICTEKGSCTWKIRQIDLLFNNHTCDYIVSDKFSKDTSSLGWQLLLYFKGSHVDSKDYLSLLVQFTDRPSCTYKLQAQYELAILNGKGEAVHKAKSNLLTFTVNESKLGELKFIKKDLLFNKKKSLLQDDNALVITCSVTFGLNKQKRYHQSSTLKYCEHKFLLAVSDDLERLLESGQHSDVTIIVEGKTFLLHRAILAVRSPSMLNMIDELFKKQKKLPVEVNDIDQVILNQVLLFIYSGKVDNLEELAKSLYTEASRFELTDLKSICEEYLCKNLVLENVCDNFAFAHVNNVRKLRSECRLFITDNLKEVIATDGYKSLAESRPQLLKDLLLYRRSS